MTSLEAGVRCEDEGGADRVWLTSPSVGRWRHPPPLGARLGPGDPLGFLEVLGRAVPLHVPAAASGVVVERPREAVREPVEYGTALAALAAEVAAEPSGSASAVAQPSRAIEGLVFRAAMGGRFYRRAAADKPPFVSEGDEIEKGRTVGLLEVMKTFTRLHYEGDGLPSRARVRRVVPEDGADLEPGDPILELEEVPGG